jgi:hypothetical protein
MYETGESISPTDCLRADPESVDTSSRVTIPSLRAKKANPEKSGDAKPRAYVVAMAIWPPGSRTGEMCNEAEWVCPGA